MCTAGCGTESNTSAGPPKGVIIGKPNGPINVNDGEWTVEKAWRATEPADGDDPERDYVIVDVRFENIESEEVSSPTSVNVTLLDGRGRRFERNDDLRDEIDSDLLDSNLDPDNDSYDECINPGLSVIVEAAFEIPGGAKGLRAEFEEPG